MNEPKHQAEETMKRDLREDGIGPEDCYPETAEVGKSDLSDLLASNFLPMESAPKDGRDIQIVFRHFLWRYAAKEDRSEWQQLCTARWTTFNRGGWVWDGLCGDPIYGLCGDFICWRPLAKAAE